MAADDVAEVKVEEEIVYDVVSRTRRLRSSSPPPPLYRWFAATTLITPERVEAAVQAFKRKGYVAGRLNRIKVGICFGDHHHPGDVDTDELMFCRLNYNPSQPLWHPDNRELVRFTSVFSTWDDHKLADAVEILVECLGLVENKIANERRAYDPARDSDLAHNVFCQYDYEAAQKRRVPPYRCDRCDGVKDPSDFVLNVEYGSELLTDTERLFYRLENEPSSSPLVCSSCAPAFGTVELDAQPKHSDTSVPVAWARHMFKDSCWVVCPLCACITVHLIKPVGEPLHQRRWGDRLCMNDNMYNCNGYNLQPSRDIMVHASSEAVEAVMGYSKLMQFDDRRNELYIRHYNY